jgi:D-alanine-D-alanine ligase
LRIAVAIVCGGQSPEHEVSLLSAKNVFNAIDKDKFDTQIIYITKDGEWKYAERNIEDLTKRHLPTLSITPGSKNPISSIDGPKQNISIDVVFPILHGQFGEDGTIQGLLKMCQLPFVGSDVLGSAISMDKDVVKRLLRDAGIPVPKFLVFQRKDKGQITFNHIAAQLKLPFFVKPTNAGSSIGINKVKEEATFQNAINEAFQYDEKIIIEEFIAGREIECAVLGNDSFEVALPGEIVPHHEFYTYTAKYLDKNGASVIVPAELNTTTIAQLQKTSIEVAKILCCAGMVRVDYFYTPDGKIIVNEINTIPGFTNSSMYPKCWTVTGLSYSSLIEKLLMLGLEKHRHAAVK